MTETKNHEFNCPESERFLSEDEIMRGHRMYLKPEECIRNFSWGNCCGSCGQANLDNAEYYLLDEYASSEGFNEYTIEEVTNNQGEVTKIVKTIQGFYVDENRARVIICDVANPNLIPKKIIEQIQDLIDIDNIYEGYEYLLVKAKDKIFTFNIQKFQSIKEIIRLMSLHIYCTIKYQTNKSGSLLVISTEQTKFLIAPMISDDSDDIERSILNDKIESARPFFEYKAIQKVNWTELKDVKGVYFEKLIETLLSKESNIVDIQTIGKTTAADRGRDFVVTENIHDTFGASVQKKWLVQCKFSENSISPKTLPDWVNRVIEHQLDGLWLITNNDITPSLYDQLNDVPKNQNFKIETRVWQRNTFDIKLATHPEVFVSGLFFK